MMNEENNVMVSEVTNEEPEQFEESSGISTGMAMLIGAGLALAGAKVLKHAKNAYGRFKEKQKSKNEEEPTVIDITDDSKNVDETE